MGRVQSCPRDGSGLAERCAVALTPGSGRKLDSGGMDQG